MTAQHNGSRLPIRTRGARRPHPSRRHTEMHPAPSHQQLNPPASGPQLRRSAAAHCTTAVCVQYYTHRCTVLRGAHRRCGWGSTRRRPARSAAPPGSACPGARSPSARPSSPGQRPQRGRPPRPAGDQQIENLSAAQPSDRGRLHKQADYAQVAALPLQKRRDSTWAQQHLQGPRKVALGFESHTASPSLPLPRPGLRCCRRRRRRESLSWLSLPSEASAGGLERCRRCACALRAALAAAAADAAATWAEDAGPGARRCNKHHQQFETTSALPLLRTWQSTSTCASACSHPAVGVAPEHQASSLPESCAMQATYMDEAHHTAGPGNIGTLTTSQAASTSSSRKMVLAKGRPYDRSSPIT
jgi:hypothetical protein